MAVFRISRANIIAISEICRLKERSSTFFWDEDIAEEESI